MTPEKTIKRLIQYRIMLERMERQGITNTFSKEMSEISGISPVQIRRDLMFVGYSGNPQKGYIVKELFEKIRQFLEPEEGISIALVGIGNLGRAILGYFSKLKPKFTVVAAFDNDEAKTGRVIAGCTCYHIREVNTVLRPFNVQLGIITVPTRQAQEAANLLVGAGIKGIVNFAPVYIKTPENIFVENMDITLTFEKVAYFARLRDGGALK